MVGRISDELVQWRILVKTRNIVLNLCVLKLAVRKCVATFMTDLCGTLADSVLHSALMRSNYNVQALLGVKET